MVAASPSVILYLHSSDDLYGADMILLEIVRGLDRSRFTPIVILPDDMRHVGLLSQELQAHGIEWMHLPIAIVRRRYFNLSGAFHLVRNAVQGTWALRRIVRERNVQIIHGFTLAVVAAPLAGMLLRVPLIMHVHEILQRPSLLRKFLHAMGVRPAQRVLCVSNATRENVLADEPAAVSRVTVLHNGIPHSPHSARSHAELRATLGVPQHLPLVGMIGRVSPWKGQNIFLEAAAQVLAKNPDCQFIAIGGVFDEEHHHLDRLQELYASLHLGEAVKLAGFRKDAREMIPAFDIFVLPSILPDPFPTVILEAMSAGTPVIATNHGGACEMVVEGETGYLITPSNPSELSLAINRLLKDPSLRARMGQAGQIRMKTYFESTRFLEEIQAEYTAVLEAESPVHGGKSSML